MMICKSKAITRNLTLITKSVKQSQQKQVKLVSLQCSAAALISFFFKGNFSNGEQTLGLHKGFQKLLPMYV